MSVKRYSNEYKKELIAITKDKANSTRVLLTRLLTLLFKDDVIKGISFIKENMLTVFTSAPSLASAFSYYHV